MLTTPLLKKVSMQFLHLRSPLTDILALLQIVFGLVLFHYLVTPVLADENFSTEVATTYSVQENGSTVVNHSFAVTNKTPTTYLTQYSLQTSNQDLRNVVAETEGTKLEPSVTTDGTLTSIALIFPTEVVGQGKARRFMISYSVSGLATVGGSVLELKLPKLASGEQFDKRTVTIVTPIRFGGPVRASRQPDTTQTSSQTFTAVFSNLGTDALSLFYGADQTFKMTLRYNLDNPSSARGLAQIALPPDTPLQKMHYHELDPLPKNMKQDEDGNWIATYELPPQTATTVYLTAYAQLSLERNQAVPELGARPEHTQGQKFWETADPTIQKKARELGTVEKIYQDVIDSLSYSEELALEATVERRGAAAAFENPDQAICQEYADAFIATARAANIPARRLTGYAFTQDSQSRPLSLSGDVLHAWAEYFDQEKNSWIPVDPTWQDTTGGVDYFSQFDLNHIVFAINGVSSTTPYPAGSYKTTDASKDVEVSFAEEFPTTAPDISITTKPRTLFGVPVPGLYRLLITNKTGQAWYDIPVAYTELQPGTTLQGVQSEIQVLLPFQTLDIPIHIRNAELLSFSETPLTITATPEQTPQRYETIVRTGPAYITAILDPKLLPYLGAGLVVCTLAAGSLLVFRRKR